MGIASVVILVLALASLIQFYWVNKEAKDVEKDLNKKIERIENELKNYRHSTFALSEMIKEMMEVSSTLDLKIWMTQEWCTKIKNEAYMCNFEFKEPTVDKNGELRFTRVIITRRGNDA